MDIRGEWRVIRLTPCMSSHLSVKVQSKKLLIFNLVKGRARRMHWRELPATSVSDLVEFHLQLLND